MGKITEYASGTNAFNVGTVWKSRLDGDELYRVVAFDGRISTVYFQSITFGNVGGLTIDQAIKAYVYFGIMDVVGMPVNVTNCRCLPSGRSLEDVAKGVFVADRKTERLDAITMAKNLTESNEILANSEEDIKRYHRLRVIGAAPFGSKQLDSSTVLRFQGLDEFIDYDIERVASRGEFIYSGQPAAIDDPLVSKYSGQE